jgi:Baseplate J-like protein
MEDFVELPFTADSASLADAAIEELQRRWEGWEPNDADLEVILIEALAPMAANAAAVAANMPAAALRMIGTKLFEIAYENALPATTLVTVTTVDVSSEDRTISAGSEMEIDGQAFTTVADAIVLALQSEVKGVLVQAVEPGAAGNGLIGSVTAPISMPVWVGTIVLEAVTSDGVDSEEDTAYQNRVSRDLRLRAKTLVTAKDYELQALNEDGIGRAHAFPDVETREMPVCLTDPEGKPALAPVKEALLAEYEKLRLSNWLVKLTDPTYTEVGVKWEVLAYPGYDHGDLEGRINSLLRQVLSPTGYSMIGDGEWWNEPTIYLDKLIALIGNVVGVDRVQKIEINGAAADFTMAGTVPLPTPGAMSGVVK